MKSLVTGGAGFIGSHLVEYLISKDHEVIVIDNLSTGRAQNLDLIRGNKNNVRFVRADVASGDIARYFEGVDYVFHLAALADVVPSIQNPLEYHRANVDGTVRVLEAARTHHVKKFIYTASSSCYGLPSLLPTPETAEIRLEHPYALTKHIGEQYVLHWGKIYHLPVVSLRLFNVYGPRSASAGSYGAVFGVFLAQKLHNKPFTVVGDGTQTRDFTYVTDVARAYYAAAESGCSGEIFNVGSGKTYSINRLVELLGGDKVYIPKRPGEPDCSLADISKIIKYLNWRPAVTFEQGVATLLENIDYWREAPLWTEDSIAEITRDWFRYLG
ncbi:SDR family oxidoreductase [Pelotomaculum isophthalicicum JI]|uniref:SDR family oxidoreductase n=1 Tax=Pelotomaculum isophthalicicum JI TaxID=947010 RepID=A0A9X4JT14_9FIRM|nr:SDR family oxidoreductase [Pelotomaculum isophthalicicum]MDF9407914.1 SDR family oxidoreductase [Pelotomaculum isophthalicicum JI]